MIKIEYKGIMIHLNPIHIIKLEQETGHGNKNVTRIVLEDEWYRVEAHHDTVRRAFDGYQDAALHAFFHSRLS